MTSLRLDESKRRHCCHSLPGLGPKCWFRPQNEPRQIAMGRQLWFPRHLLVSHRHQSETQSSGTGGDKCIEANQIRWCSFSCTYKFPGISNMKQRLDACKYMSFLPLNHNQRVAIESAGYWLLLQKNSSRALHKVQLHVAHPLPLWILSVNCPVCFCQLVSF